MIYFVLLHIKRITYCSIRVKMFSDDMITTGISLNVEDSCTLSIYTCINIGEHLFKFFFSYVKNQNLLLIN